MEKTTIGVIIVIILLIIFSVGIGIYLWKYSNNATVCELKGMDEKCKYYIEKKLDTSIQVPKSKPIINEFKKDVSLINKTGWLQGTYFSVCYIDKKTGSYGNLGPWSDIVVAYTGKCDYNYLTMKYEEIHNMNKEDYVPQLHVQESKYDEIKQKWNPVNPNERGHPVSVMTPLKVYNGSIYVSSVLPNMSDVKEPCRHLPKY